ncbi:efflux RND transporter periplasmic adaptor subunit [Trinickia fusca]|uniref:Efflux RND transporter periplasmic adaptor subunit n=1 Tax=Trinickia fusca TaxID=2419777 RepID=A0A494XR63_9BURK|nr:efflux RND transporter periplasmic adaptor subunit [Trinickia fusca]RKP52312.1 efflux RND transporter periplasmic adaptor subunit [Trinickia fusca]
MRWLITAAVWGSWLAASPALSHAAETYECLIEPTQTVELGTPVGGQIERVTVKRGDKVTHNQVLATLESHAEQAAADLARYKSQLAGPTQLAQSKIDFSQRKFARRREMADAHLMAKQDSDDAESELKQAQAELTEAKENREVSRLEYVHETSQLNLRTIRSPFDGVVVDQMMWPGEIVEPGATKHTVLKVAQLNPLRVRMVLPLRAFGTTHIGMTASVISEVEPNTPYSAKVISVDRIVDAASGTFVVFLDLPNPKLDLPAGVKCKATLRN